jgi:hypothetical protein
MHCCHLREKPSIIAEKLGELTYTVRMYIYNPGTLGNHGGGYVHKTAILRRNK